MFLVSMPRESRDLARSVDRFFDDAFGSFLASPAATRGEVAARSPALDVAESDRAYTVKVEMPGVRKEDIKVTVEGKRVSVLAQIERQSDKQSEVQSESREAKPETPRAQGERVIHRERSAARYARSFALPLEVDQAGAGARFENGVLTLELPKRSAGAAAQITIN
jgi:HSP20 family protein